MSDQPESMGIDEAVDYIMSKHEDTEPSEEDSTPEVHEEVSDNPGEGSEPDEEVEDEVEPEEEDEEPESDEDDQGTEESTEDEAEYVFTYTDDETGEEVKVTSDEAKSGYLRQRDYTRKTQALAEERKQIQEKEAELTPLKQQLEQTLQQLEYAADAELQQFVGIDWKKLEQEDPYEYEEKARRFDALRRQHEQAKIHREAVAQQLYAEYEQQLEVLREQEQAKLLERDPEFNAEKDLPALQSLAAERYGFTEEELQNVLDHRALLVLRDAQRYHELNAKLESGKSKAAKASKSVRPGAKQSPGAAKKRQAERLRERARKTGSLEDALEFLMSTGGV